MPARKIHVPIATFNPIKAHLLYGPYAAEIGVKLRLRLMETLGMAGVTLIFPPKRNRFEFNFNLPADVVPIYILESIDDVYSVFGADVFQNSWRYSWLSCHAPDEAFIQYYESAENIERPPEYISFKIIVAAPEPVCNLFARNGTLDPVPQASAKLRCKTRGRPLGVKDKTPRRKARRCKMTGQPMTMEGR
jgi:hypothetical protein